MTTLFLLTFVISFITSTCAFPIGAGSAILARMTIPHDPIDSSKAVASMTEILRHVPGLLSWPLIVGSHGQTKQTSIDTGSPQKGLRRRDNAPLPRQEFGDQTDRPGQSGRFFPYDTETESAPSSSAADSVSSSNAPLPFFSLGPVPVLTTIFTATTDSSTLTAVASSTNSVDIPSGVLTLPPTTAVSTAEPPQEPVPASSDVPATTVSSSVPEQSTATTSCSNTSASEVAPNPPATVSASQDQSQPGFPVIVTVAPDPQPAAATIIVSITTTAPAAAAST